MADPETAIGPKVNVPQWVWAAALLTGVGGAGAGGALLGGEPAATKAELAAVEDQIEALEDTLDDRLDGIERTMERLTYTLPKPEAP